MQGNAFKICPHCQAQCPINAQYCWQCMRTFQTVFPTQAFAPLQHSHYGPAGGFIQKYPGTHSVWAAILLSALCFHGIGQMYNGQVLKGVVLLCCGVFLAVLTGGLSLLITYPLVCVDAGMVAHKLFEGRPVGQWEFF